MRGTKNNTFFVSGKLAEEPIVSSVETKNGAKDVVHFVITTEKEDFDEDVVPCTVSLSSFGARKIERLQNTGVGAPITVKGYLEANFNVKEDRWFTNIRVSSISAPEPTAQQQSQPRQPAARASDSLDYSNQQSVDDIPF